MKMDAVFGRRRERARALMAEAGIAALALAPTTDLYWLAGFRGHIGDRLTVFVLTAERAVFLYPVFEKAGINRELLESADCVPHTDGGDPYALFADFLPRGGAVAVDTRLPAGTLFRFQEYAPGRRWLDAGKIINPLRLIKDDEEFRLLQEAQTRAGRALEKLYAWGLAGRAENSAAEKLTALCAEEGLEKAAWGPIVASGANGASPHHESGEKTIQDGDAVVIDFGGVYGGYQADMTRTPAAGKATEEFREVYATVLAANEAAFEAARPGAACETVDAAARGVIEKAGRGEYFTHRLGHGIGLDYHEDPYIVKGNTLPLAAGMAFSDEPGIYLPGKFGVRTEDILFMKESGAARLGNFSLALREI